MIDPRRWFRRGVGGLDLGEPIAAPVRHPLTGRGTPMVTGEGPTRQEWLRRVRTDNASRTACGQLERAYGPLYAELFLELVVDTVARPPQQSLDLVTPAYVAEAIGKELDRFHERKRYVHSLLQRLDTGVLGPLLDANLDPAAANAGALPNGLLAPRDRAIELAARWLTGNRADQLPLTRKLLQDYIPIHQGAPGRCGNAALGVNDQALRDMHRTLASDSSRYRFNTATVPYPSSIGGSLLLKHIFLMTGDDDAWPPFGDPRWGAIALFYLASIVTVQGFGDGNKRAGHAAYAVCLIKNTHQFKAPSLALENKLFRMDN